MGLFFPAFFVPGRWRGASSSSRRAQGCGGIRPLKRRLVDLGFHLKQESSRASPMKLIKLYPHMSGEQKRLIEGAGFHGLVDLKCSKLRPDLCSWLMEHFNPATNQLVFPGRGAIDVNEESVKSVLGIPMGDKDVSYEMESEATEFVLNLLGINDGISPSLTSLGIQLEKLKLADDKYLRMWIIYAISSVLAPTTATTVSPRCYPSVVDAGNVKNLNWCKFIISILQKAAKAGKNTNSACLLYMMILYLDSLSFKNLNVPVEGYRATVWTNEMINQAILADTSADGSFGALPHEGTNLFGSNVDFSTFINSNVPNTMQQQEKDRIVIAVQNLCEGFSGLVTKFVRQISGLDFVDPRGSQPRKMRMNRKKLAQWTKRVQQDEDLDVTSSDDEDFVADEEEVEDTEEDEYTDEDGDSDDDEDEGDEDDDDEGEEDDDEDRSENDDDDGAKTGRSGEQADAATDVTGCKGDDTNEGIGSGGKDVDGVTECKGDDTNEGIGCGGKGADDVIGKGKQVDEGIGFGDKKKHEEKQAPNAVAQNVPESEKQPLSGSCATPKGQEAAGTSQGKEFPGIITNEDYGSFTTEDYEKVGREADEAIASKSATKSPVAEVISKEPIACEVEEETPVPHEYNKRVVKPAKFKRSPLIDYENKKQFMVSRVINEVYDDICKNGGRTKSRRNSQKIIDTGEYYIYLSDLANSVKPMGSLDNNTCELALIVLSTDIKDNSKRIFPARIGGYLLDSQLDRNELKKHFDQTRANHLDHKELAFFPILQELGNGNDKASHYFVVCLNLKAERFEVYDSLRGEDDEALISASHLVVASIKTMWDRFYMRFSKKTI
uniref:Ubiquitin-like protease family profile domain-containing protein n=1 Tax=Oryza sativa subsp. japonica TaxID=39947 RepID=Q6K2T2_ORYSJ|nr:hypothetical protein [Oryza sativa Japonica Group]BAD28889.1 hypothetical protein [Oryza sativa Japonica Group]